MKYAALIVNTLIRAIALFLLAGTLQAAPVVFQSTETPPYWSAQLPDNGYGGSILKLLSDAAQVPYSIEYLPVKRFRNSTATFIVGDPDVLISQKHRAIFPIAIFHSAFFYYKPRHDVIEYHSLRDLQGYTLGVLRGTIENKADFLRNGVSVEESDSIESLFRKLKQGRIDFCITVIGAGNYTIQRSFPAEQHDFVQSRIPGLDRPIAIMIDVDVPEGKIMAGRYRQVLDKTLHSREYHDRVEAFYGKGNIPADREQQLNKFITNYAPSWDN